MIKRPGLPLTPGVRRQTIAAVLEARFSLSVFEASRRADAAAWASPRNDMARGIYSEALREKAWLDASADSVLLAEAGDLGFACRTAPGAALAASRAVHSRTLPIEGDTSMNPSNIREQMKVIGSDRQPVGTVDKVEGNRIKLGKSDPQAQGRHHFIPTEWVERVDGQQVVLKQSAQDTVQKWQND